LRRWGVRAYYPYPNEADALTDVLRLSRAMSYKSAMARLPLGGGKTGYVHRPGTATAAFMAVSKSAKQAGTVPESHGNGLLI